jgi:hypothetical protein
VIYQHRLIVARPGRLPERNAVFEGEMVPALDAHGSVLIGAWEVWVGPESGRAVVQLRQFDSLAAWAQHQDRVRQDTALAERRNTELSPYLDYVNTAIVQSATGAPALPEAWPAVAEVKGQPVGVFEQRVLQFAPGAATEHHDFYFKTMAPALEFEDARLFGLFDTVIGPGTMNADSHCSIELRRFPSLGHWQRWREAQEPGGDLYGLIHGEWLPRLVKIESMLLRPMDYSRIR